MVTLKLTLEEAQDLLWEVQFTLDTYGDMNENEVGLGVYDKGMYDNLLSVKAKLEAAEDVEEEVDKTETPKRPEFFVSGYEWEQKQEG